MVVIVLELILNYVVVEGQELGELVVWTVVLWFGVMWWRQKGMAVW